jgi:hypothetical protein
MERTERWLGGATVPWPSNGVTRNPGPRGTHAPEL